MTDWLEKIKLETKARQAVFLSSPDTARPVSGPITAEEFCQAVLPQSGHYCLQEIRAGSGVKPAWVASSSEAARHALELDEGSSANVYVAVASFATPHNRKAANVALKRSLYADLDTGTGKFPDKRAALEGLKSFCDGSGIPFPTLIVDSGNGIHVHWPLASDIPPAEWRVMALNLKAAFECYGFAADPSVTADIARILRIPGTMNRKNPIAPRQVTARRLGPPHDAAALAQSLAIAADGGSARAGAVAIAGTLPRILGAELGDNVDLTNGVGSTAWFANLPIAQQISELRGMLAALPLEHADEHDKWIATLAEISSAKSIPVDDRIDLAWAFSQRSEKSRRESRERVAMTMAGLGERTSVGALRKRAEQFGYVLRHDAPDGRYPSKEAAEAALASEYIFVADENKYMCSSTRQLLMKDAIRERESWRMPDCDLGRWSDPPYMLRKSKKTQRCDSVGFHPREGTTFYEGGRNLANLFRPLNTDPIKPTRDEQRLLLRFLMHLFPTTTDRKWLNHLLDTFAFLVQNPGKRVRFAMILVGEVEGSGKSTLMEEIPKRLFGQENVSKPSPSEVESSFTDWLGQAWIVVFAEISIGTNREASKIVDALKDNITSDVLRIHGKSLKGRSQVNRVSFFGTSNHEDHALHLSQHDRRFGICKTSSSRMPEALANDLYSFLDSARGAGVLRYLAMHRDLSRFNPHAPPPTTEAKLTMIEASLGPVAGEIVDAWRDREPPFDKDLVAISSVRVLLTTKGIDTRTLSDRRIGQVLKQAPVNARRIERQIRVNVPGQGAWSKVRYWIVRNAERWCSASEGAIDAHLSGRSSALTTHTHPRMEESNKEPRPRDCAIGHKKAPQ